MTSEKAVRQPPELDEYTLNPDSAPAEAIVDRVLSAERERIATHLHDDVLQSFATCLLDSQICERLVQSERHDLLLAEFARLQDALNDTVDRIRQLISTLK